MTASDTTNSDIVGKFDPRVLRAPFPLRIAAASTDYILVFSVPLLALVIADALSDRANPPSVGLWGWLLTLIVFVVNSIALPLIFGRSVGKWLFGMTIVSDAGGPLSLGKVIVRNVFGYLLIPATLGIGFFIAGISSKGRALHDLIAKTVVVRGSKQYLN
ncbi:MAG: RDD family protein [Acidobacteriota bacterium]|nr:MAG: RDD family protein [Acidobacteriota bacterium]